MPLAGEPVVPMRASGVLLHPTSLPGPYGIGDLGPAAYQWIDWLARARQRWWQVLPLGPTGYGDSPYQSFSSFAGNLNLLSPHGLIQDGLLRAADVEPRLLPEADVDFGQVEQFKSGMVRQAWETFQSASFPALHDAFEEFCALENSWSADYALFMAVKAAQSGVSWQEWPTALMRRSPAALADARANLRNEIGLYQFGQFLFFRQWGAIRNYAHQRGVKLIGDIPIFVAGDSADVWANPELFVLDAERKPAVVAGVPPDYFSSTGQLWGNPLYDWERHRRENYAWWSTRLKATLRQVDLVRIDHFRGFEAYWEIPAGMPTAQVGRWVPGPGTDLFTSLRQNLGGLPVIAEDLGLITPEVLALRDSLGLPGMSVLQFAFGGGPDNKYLPHNHERRSVVYTGTHDNDTTAGWFATLDKDVRRHVVRYVPGVEADPTWTFVRLAWSSVANLSLAPLQDLLRLGTEGRMNTPGKPAENWRWRCRTEALTAELADQLAEWTEIYGRA